MESFLGQTSSSWLAFSVFLIQKSRFQNLFVAKDVFKSSIASFKAIIKNAETITQLYLSRTYQGLLFLKFCPKITLCEAFVIKFFCWKNKIIKKFDMKQTPKSKIFNQVSCVAGLYSVYISLYVPTSCSNTMLIDSTSLAGQSNKILNMLL